MIAVRELFDYDPMTGVLTWRVRAGPRVAGDVAGSKNGRGYIYVRVNRRTYAVHRVIFLWMTGDWPQHEIDHINLDKGDNRWANLRDASRVQNSGNIPAHKRNKCGLKGTRRHPNDGRWRSRITVNGKGICLGTYDTPQEAHAAYIEAAQRYFGAFARAT